MTEWCILRTMPGSTIALAEALGEEGFTVWTPVAKFGRRLPRSKVTVDATMPVTPTFVFAAYDRLADLVRLAEAPALNYRVWDKEQRRMVVRGRPHFTIFRLAGHVPQVPDAQLDPLREYEVDAAERASRRRRRGKKGALSDFRIGQSVEVPEGPFAGMVGVVVKANKFVRVSFAVGGKGIDIEIDIAPWILQSIAVDMGNPDKGTAAIAA